MKNAAKCASECELQDTWASTFRTHIAVRARLFVDGPLLFEGRARIHNQTVASSRRALPVSRVLYRVVRLRARYTRESGQVVSLSLNDVCAYSCLVCVLVIEFRASAASLAPRGGGSSSPSRRRGRTLCRKSLDACTRACVERARVFFFFLHKEKKTQRLRRTTKSYVDLKSGEITRRT